jgi:mannan endo-1,6-alpha-mannosidase
MLDYSHYTGDATYDRTIATALLAQVGPGFDYMLPKHFGDEGNDDQAFWGFAVMSAAERNFPQPNSSVPAWIDLGANLWNSLQSRWNTTTCGGGLMWQIFASNPHGLHYKNSVSNGGFFQISARLARATGNKTYSDWAEKIWDWTVSVDMIDSDFNVRDGADTANNCADMTELSFSYSAGIYIYGAAVMYNLTGNSTWSDRAIAMLEASRSFFSPFDNATDIMYEHACEQVNTCNADMLSFKGYYSRFVYASTLMVPAMVGRVASLMGKSVTAAANSCTGGANGTTCGEKWYVGGYDGNTGLGQEMCALEIIQGLLVANSTPPFKGDQIKVIRDFALPPVSTPTNSTSPPESTPSKRSNASGSLTAGLSSYLPSALASLLVSRMI